MFKNIHLSYYFFSQEDRLCIILTANTIEEILNVKWDIMSEDILQCGLLTWI